MLCIRSSGLQVYSRKLLTNNVRNIVSRLAISNNCKTYTKMAVIKSNFRQQQRMFHLAKLLTIKEKDEYHAKLALKETKDKELVSREFFEASSEKNRETFKSAIELFNKRDIRKRGSVEFIYAALKHMKQFDCHRLVHRI